MQDSRATEAGEITRLLAVWRHGGDAINALFPLLYRELRAMAHRQRRGGGDTLQTTALVHEAYLKLVDHDRVEIQDRRHFLALASRVMRQVAVDAARSRASLKRGGDRTLVSLDDQADTGVSSPIDVLVLDAALEKLGALDERLCRVVELRVFSGLTVEETADVLETSPRTVKRDWRKARAFLYAEIVGTGAGSRR